MSKLKRPRAWSDPGGCSSTKMLYDPGVPGAEVKHIFMHTNMGWIPIEPDEEIGLENQCESIAKAYGLTEVSRDTAIWLAGYADQEDDFED